MLYDVELFTAINLPLLLPSTNKQKKMDPHFQPAALTLHWIIQKSTISTAPEVYREVEAHNC